MLADAAERGILISLDPNFHPKLWDSREKALETLADIYPLVTLTKPSLDDATRLFGAGQSTDFYLDHFHDLGARTVVFTLGPQGVWLSTSSGVLPESSAWGMRPFLLWAGTQSECT